MINMDTMDIFKDPIATEINPDIMSKHHTLRAKVTLLAKPV